MRPRGYTLAELAWFNRCLFPETLTKGLIAEGIDPSEARNTPRFYQKNVKMGILGLYQEW